MTNREALKKWDQVVANIRKLKPVPPEKPAAKEKRIARLKKDWIACSKYYFPDFASVDFAWFHKRAARAIIDADLNDDKAVYAVLAFAREHGKTALMMFVLFYLKVTKRAHNVLMVSNSFDAAVDLIMPLVLNLERNQRIISDFGEQKSLGQWENGRWVCRDGFSLRCIGAGQSPRGTRAEEKRPDFIAIDDIDTDEECKNQARIDKKWEWIEQALFPTMSLVETKRFAFLGNIISKSGCIMKAWAKADFKLKVNLLDDKGVPSWKERYTRKQADYMLSKISYASGQKEYFNNPINEGSVFKELTWGKVPPLRKFRFVVAYCDPSYRDSRKNDFKAIPLIGELDGIFYILDCRLEQTTTAQMIAWYYDYDERVQGRCGIYHLIEEGGLQRTFYEDIFLKELRQVGIGRGKHLSIAADRRKKPDKFTRIESTLEPLNRQQRLVLNEAERTNPHMLRLEEQFKAIMPSLPGHDDGPDAVEGGVWFINNKLRVIEGAAGSAARSSNHF